MDHLVHLSREYTGCPLQWFGDMTKTHAETKGLAQSDAKGIALFITDETVMLLMQEWANKQLCTSDSPALPDHQTLTSALRTDRDAAKHNTSSIQLFLDCHDTLTAHRSADLSWDFGRISSDDVRAWADEVLLGAMRLYWLTYASSDPGVTALCPTTGAQAFGSWPRYDPQATYRFR